MALEAYKRFADSNRLAQDASLETTTAFYPPHFEKFSEAEVGGNSPNKVGAMATFKDGNRVKMAVYQGEGIWASSVSDTESIKNESLSFDATSDQINGLYPDMPIGGIIYNEVDNVMFIKVTGTKWRMQALDFI